MNNEAYAIIFSGLEGDFPAELTRERSIGAVPFACRYRLVDFPLSNMINKGIKNIDIVTDLNYRSLVRHVGSGKDFDLANRRSGIRFITPYGTQGIAFKTRLESLRSMLPRISEHKEDFVILADSKTLLNIDLKEMSESHISSGADITLAVAKARPFDFHREKRLYLSKNEKDSPEVRMLDSPKEGFDLLSLGVFIMKNEYLKRLIEEAESREEKSLYRLIIKESERAIFNTYIHRGYYKIIDSLYSYFCASMDILGESCARVSLLCDPHRPIFTRVNSSPPTSYLSGSSVKGSMIADGCIIKGEVINSVLSRGVVVEEGAVIKNSVLLRGTRVSKGARLSYIVSDKYLTVEEGVTLLGNEKHPFFIGGEGGE